MQSINKLILTLLLTIYCINPILISKSQSNDNQIKYDTIQELIPNHNINTDKRINLVFNIENNKDYDIHKLVQKHLVGMIGWNGPILSLNYDNDPNIKRGFFATDPIRNYKHKFNVWVRYQKESVIEENSDYNKLENKVLIKVNNTKQSMAYTWKDEVPIKKTPYIDLRNTPDNFTFNSSWAYVLTHELGHSIFSFEDEYETTIRYRNDYRYDEGSYSTLEQVYQNIQDNKKCVNNLPIKPKYFGQLDPMYDEVINDYKNLGIDKKIKKEDFEVNYYKRSICSGKYSLEDINNFSEEGSTVYSIMEGSSDTNYNIWGSLKKVEIEKFLSQFEGAGDVIPYVKKVFIPDDYNQIKGKVYQELYPENNLMVKKAYYNYVEEKPKSITIMDNVVRIFWEFINIIFQLFFLFILLKLIQLLFDKTLKKLKL